MVKATKASVVKRQAEGERCHRCGGLMVSEPVFELASVDWHCVSCGERIDPVILSHRRNNLVRAEAEKLFVGHEKPRLD